MTGQEDVLEDNLARWLQPAGVQLSSDHIPKCREAVGEMSRDLSGREFDVVRAAHSVLNDATRSWIGNAMRAQDQSFVAEGKDALLTRLAGAAVIQALVSSTAPAAILVNLAVESALFLGFDPVISETGAISARELAATARQVRESTDHNGSATAAIGKLPTERKPDADTGEAVTADVVAKDVFAQTKALRALAAYVDQLDEARHRRQDALDEEVEILWWVLLGRDSDGVTWGGHVPLDRAARAAQELSARTLKSPGPPAAAYFLGHILSSDAESETSIAGLAEAASAMNGVPSGNDGLLPITSTIHAYREVSGDRKLWPRLAETKFAIPVNRKTTLLDAAEQLYRELEMLRLVAA